MPGAALSVSTFVRASVSASGAKRASSARAGPRASASATVGAGENADAMDAERLATWRRLLADVPLAEVLPRDNAFGVDVPVEARNPDITERLAFFGDKLLNAAVAEALYETQMRAGGLNSPLGEMTKLVAAARSNALFARLLPRLLREDMVAAVPPDALAARTKHHSVGTMVEAAVFLVHRRGGHEGAVAVAEVGAFLLSQAEVGSPLARDVANHKGVMYEFMAKGASGSMRARGLGPQSPEQLFEATATLDGATAVATARTKREAEQRAARGVFEALIRDGRWAGTTENPVPPPEAFERREEEWRVG